FFFSSRRRHTRFSRDWSSDVCSSDLAVTDFGLQDVFEEGFNEVYRSNMSKFVENTHDASESVNRLLDKGVESNYKKVGDLFVIRRNEDDKILKGMYFTPPNLKKIINSKFGKK